jgi:hypothetical protein
MTQAWREICHSFIFLLLTMTFPRLSLSSFHDAHQVLSPQNQSRTTPASAVGAMPANENTPIGQRRLFTQRSSRDSDNIEDVN